MNNLKTKLPGAWMLTVVGLSLTTLPLYSDLFTKEQQSAETSETNFGVTSRVSFTMMYVSPWIPFGGGIMTLTGALLVGRFPKTKM